MIDANVNFAMLSVALFSQQSPPPPPDIFLLKLPPPPPQSCRIQSVDIQFAFI